MANNKRKKVMKFAEHSPCSVDTANGFMVERVKKTPPPAQCTKMDLTGEFHKAFQFEVRHKIPSR